MTQRRDFMNFHDHLMTRQECTSGTKKLKKHSKKKRFFDGKKRFFDGKKRFFKKL